MTREEVIADIKKKLEDPNFYEYGLLAYMLRDFIAQENENLRMLIYLLGDPNEYCSKADVQYVIERLEGG